MILISNFTISKYLEKKRFDKNKIKYNFKNLNYEVRQFKFS